MEATIFSGWIYDHLLPHATQIKVAHPLMLRAIAAAKKKNDQIAGFAFGVDLVRETGGRFCSSVRIAVVCRKGWLHLTGSL